MSARDRARGLTALLFIIALLLAGGWAYDSYVRYGSNPSSNTSTETSLSSSTAAGANSTGTSSLSTRPSTSHTTETSQSFALGWLTDDPAVENGSAKIDFPPNYSALANYTLALINKDRTSAGLAPVSLSPIESGQQHADSMAYSGYFGHWDPQGYKPYMRYTLLGGEGALSENVAYYSCTTPSWTFQEACSTQNVENALNASEWTMMNNDSACCSNGHRENILDPFHNRVSIGVAYDNNLAFLVEDFENSYLGTQPPILASNGTVSITGAVTNKTFVAGTEEQVEVFYDPLPQPLKVGFNSSTPELPPACSQGSCAGYSICSGSSELNETAACEYWGGYGYGPLVGDVFMPCPAGYVCGNETSTGAPAFYADGWTSTGSSVSARFSLQPMVQKHGNGVYTLDMFDNAGNEWITFSLFITGS